MPQGLLATPDSELQMYLIIMVVLLDIFPNTLRPEENGKQFLYISLCIFPEENDVILMQTLQNVVPKNHTDSN